MLPLLNRNGEYRPGKQKWKAPGWTAHIRWWTAASLNIHYADVKIPSHLFFNITKDRAERMRWTKGGSKNGNFRTVEQGICSHTVIELDKAGFEVVIVTIPPPQQLTTEVLNRLKTIRKRFLYEGILWLWFLSIGFWKEKHRFSQLHFSRLWENLLRGNPRSTTTTILQEHSVT